MNEQMTDHPDRVSIWSVDRDDLNFFSYVFPIAVAFNCLYYAFVMVNWAVVWVVHRDRAVLVGSWGARRVGRYHIVDYHGHKEGYHGLV